MIKTIIFDLDGVLVDTKKIHFLALNRALIDANKPIHDVQAIAVSIGPGSFTGLRIGLGFSKGLAYAKGLPIVPVPTLSSLAFSQKEFEPKNGIMHSHAKKVFYQAFYWENKIDLKEREPFKVEKKITFISLVKKYFSKKARVLLSFIKK